jgi:Zn-finger nucleic acid-binding protein
LTAKPSNVACPSCHAEQFSLQDASTGLLRCAYCRNHWIDERFIKKSETERFIEKQAAKPQAPPSSTSDADTQMLGAIASIARLFTNPFRGCLYSLRRTLLVVAFTVLAIAVLVLVVYVIMSEKGMV